MHTLPISILKFLWIPICSFFKNVKNYLCRPKLNIEYRTKDIKFTDKNGNPYADEYVCLHIINNSAKTYHLRPGNLKINQENYRVGIQTEENFCKLNPASAMHFVDCDNEIYKYYHSNWLAISKNEGTFELIPQRDYFFPLKGCGLITRYDNKAPLFNRKNKICVSMVLNNREYSYGLNRIKIYEKFINYIVSYSKRFYDRQQPGI